MIETYLKIFKLERVPLFPLEEISIRRMCLRACYKLLTEKVVFQKDKRPQRYKNIQLLIMKNIENIQSLALLISQSFPGEFEKKLKFYMEEANAYFIKMNLFYAQQSKKSRNIGAYSTFVRLLENIPVHLAFFEKCTVKFLLIKNFTMMKALVKRAILIANFKAENRQHKEAIRYYLEAVESCKLMLIFSGTISSNSRNKKSYNKSISLLMMVIINLCFSFDTNNDISKVYETLKLGKFCSTIISDYIPDFQIFFYEISPKFFGKYDKYIKEISDMQQFFRIIFPYLEMKYPIENEPEEEMYKKILYSTAKKSPEYFPLFHNDKILLSDINEDKISIQEEEVTPKKGNIFRQAINKIYIQRADSRKNSLLTMRRNSTSTKLKSYFVLKSDDSSIIKSLTTRSNLKTEEEYFTSRRPSKVTRKFSSPSIDKNENDKFFKLFTNKKGSPSSRTLINSDSSMNIEDSKMYIQSNKCKRGYQNMDEHFNSLIRKDLSQKEKNEEYNEIIEKINEIKKETNMNFKTTKFVKNELHFKSSNQYFKSKIDTSKSNSEISINKLKNDIDIESNFIAISSDLSKIVSKNKKDKQEKNSMVFIKLKNKRSTKKLTTQLLNAYSKDPQFEVLVERSPSKTQIQSMKKVTFRENKTVPIPQEAKLNNNQAIESKNIHSLLREYEKQNSPLKMKSPSNKKKNLNFLSEKRALSQSTKNIAVKGIFNKKNVFSFFDIVKFSKKKSDLYNEENENNEQGKRSAIEKLRINMIMNKSKIKKILQKYRETNI